MPMVVIRQQSLLLSFMGRHMVLYRNQLKLDMILLDGSSIWIGRIKSQKMIWYGLLRDKLCMPNGYLSKLILLMMLIMEKLFMIERVFRHIRLKCHTMKNMEHYLCQVERDILLKVGTPHL